MPSNRGRTTLKCRRPSRNPMGDYDRLPPELRRWVASAMLPWRAKTVLSAYKKAKARMGTTEAALAELDRLQRSKVARDACHIWMGNHPEAASYRA